MSEFSRNKKLGQARIKFLSSCRINKNIKFVTSEKVNLNAEICY
jgi:hypothetical protein